MKRKALPKKLLLNKHTISDLHPGKMNEIIAGNELPESYPFCNRHSFYVPECSTEECIIDPSWVWPTCE